MAKIKKQQKEEILQLVTTRYNKALDFQRPLFTKFNEYYQLYRGIIDKRMQNYAGRAQLFIPYIYSTIETIMPRMVGNKPKIEAVPREPGDADAADSTSQLLDYQWDIMNMKEKIKDLVRQGLIYGVGMLKLTWSFIGEFGNIEQDMPQADVVDLFDIFIDPDASTIHDAQYVIHRTERHIEELKKNENYDCPKELFQQVEQNEYKVQRDAITGLSKPKDSDKKLVELLEYWGKYDLDGDGIDEECLLTVANRAFVIRAEFNPYKHGKKPFISFFDNKLPHEFWAIGEVEPLKSLQYELNDVRNQRMDNVTLILNRMWKVKKSADVDEDELVSQAGGIVHTNDMQGLDVIETPDVTSSSYNEETLIKADMQTTSGITDYSRGKGGSEVQGQAGLGNQTATGIMLLQEAGNARFRYKLDNLEDTLTEFGRQLIALDQQFIDTNIVIRVLGQGGNRWKDVVPEEINKEYDLRVEAGSTQPMNKSVRRAEARELLATVAPFAQLGVNLQYFLKYLLQTYDLTDLNQAFYQQQPIGVPEQVAEAGGGPSGSVLGGDVGNRPNPEVTGLANPKVPSGETPTPTQ